jgi:hypothetical protein
MRGCFCFSQSKSPLELSQFSRLRTAEVSYTNQNKTAWKSEVVQTLGWPLPICVQTFPCVNESFWLAKYFHPFKLWFSYLTPIYMSFKSVFESLFSQSKSPLELSQFSRLWRLSRMQMGFLSKTDLKDI